MIDNLMAACYDYIINRETETYFLSFSRKFSHHLKDDS